MPRPWRVAVVGCGSFANGQYLPNIKKEADAVCVAAVDIIEQRAVDACEKYGIPNHYPCIQQCLAECQVDIVIDAASIQAHHEINMAALSLGKHLISQKPAAPTVDMMTEQIELARRMGVKFACAPIHNMRYDLNIAKQMMADGAIGRPYYAKSNMSHGGPEYFQYRAADPSWFFEPGAGALVDMGVHGLQQVTYLMGPAKRVNCVAAVTTPKREVRSGALDGKVIKADMLPDEYLITLEFEDNRLGFVDCGFAQKASRDPQLQIFGDEGTIAFTKPYMTNPIPEIYIDAKERGLRGWVQPAAWTSPPRPLQSQCCVLRDLIDAIETNGRPALSAEHARHVIEIMCAVDEALRLGHAVDLHTTF